MVRVDIVVFSPPFANQVIGSTSRRAKEYSKQWSVNKVGGGNRFLTQIYSDDKENLANLPYGSLEDELS